MFDGIDTIFLGSGACVINLPEAWYDDEDGYPGTYRVLYSHGDGTTPGDVLAVVCATLDEWHQTMTLTRTGRVHDVVLDAMGALAGRFAELATSRLVTTRMASRTTCESMLMIPPREFTLTTAIHITKSASRKIINRRRETPRITIMPSVRPSAISIKKAK